MSEHLRAVAAKRANKYTSRDFDPSQLTPLGQRLWAMVQHAGFSSPRDFAAAAHGSKGKGGNLSTQLERLKADGKSGGPKLDQLIAYAKFARVSLLWLITGDGAPNQGPYAELTGDEMRAMPENLARAAKAMMELDRRSAKTVTSTANALLEKHGRAGYEAGTWLELMRDHIKRGESGVRESVRVAGAPPLDD